MIFNGDGMLDPAEFWAFITAVCAFIISSSAAFRIIVDAIKKLRAPEKTQDDRLKVIEERLDLFETYFLNDKKRIDAMESGNRVTQRAILALLSHAIDGDNQDQLETARDNLNEYLINR
jgi:hypothetical protein